MGRASLSKAMKGKKKLFRIPWNQPDPGSATTPANALLRSLLPMVNDPLKQCITILVLVSSLCFFLKARRRTKSKAVHSVLSSAPRSLESMKQESLPLPEDEGTNSKNISPAGQTMASKVMDSSKTQTMRRKSLSFYDVDTIGATLIVEEMMNNKVTTASSQTSPQKLLLEFANEEGFISLPSSAVDTTRGAVDNNAKRRENSVSMQGSGENSMAEDSSCHRSLSSTSHGSYHTRNSTRRNSGRSVYTCDSSTCERSLESGNDKPAYFTVYYASQSGTSAYYATQLQREGSGMGFDIALGSVRSVAEHLKKEPFPEQALRNIMVPHKSKRGKPRGRAAFLVSTYHEGGPTDDAKDFVELLQTLEQSDCLRGLRYSVFGFGDTGYGKTFNMQAKIYDELLEQLGAKRFTSVGLGDQAKDLEYDFEIFKWRKFWPRLADLDSRDSVKVDSLSGNESGQPTVEVKFGVKTMSRLRRGISKTFVTEKDEGFILQLLDTSGEMSPSELPIGTIHPSARHLVKGVDCRVTLVTKLWRDEAVTASQTRPCTAVYVEFDLEPSAADGGIPPFRYATGDNICVLPVNKLSVVEAVAKHLDCSLDTTFRLSPQSGDLKSFQPPFPTPCTVRDYLSFFCELSTPPRRPVVRALSQYAADDHDRDELYRLSSSKNYQEFKSLFVDERLGLADVITRYFPSLHFPLLNFIRLCSPLQARWYSVSSSSLVNPHTLSITFSTISIPRTIDDSICRGACSHYLADLNPDANDTVRIIRMGSSGFVAPKDPMTPLVMVCNGTGIAPFRALLQEINYKKINLKQETGPVLLFYGIRHRDDDLLFKEELNLFVRNGTLTDIYIACSREDEVKVYVQDVLARYSEKTWSLLQLGSHFYTCGATAMTREVDLVLRNVASRYLDTDAVNTFMAELEENGRYVREGWTSVRS